MPDDQPIKREKKNPFEENKKDIVLVGAGAILFAAGIIAEKNISESDDQCMYFHYCVLTSWT